jgi:hypothetical protein
MVERACDDLRSLSVEVERDDLGLTTEGWLLQEMPIMEIHHYGETS